MGRQDEPNLSEKMKLNQITIPSLDLSVAIPFYQTLGLELIVHTHADYARFVCPDGGATVSIHRVDALGAGEGIYVYFECEDLDARAESLIQAGIVFDQMPRDESWLWREARLKDPDGNQLVLYYAGENRLNPPWRLKA